VLKDILEIVVLTLTIVKLLKELKPKKKRQKKKRPTKGNAKQRTEGNATSLFHPYIYILYQHLRKI